MKLLDSPRFCVPVTCVKTQKHVILACRTQIWTKKRRDVPKGTSLPYVNGKEPEQEDDLSWKQQDIYIALLFLCRSFYSYVTVRSF